jgi:hypothetical protein
VEVGIDFVGDPVVSEEESEQGARQPEEPTVALPSGAESRELHGEVDEISGAVEGVGDEREDGEKQEGSECECGTKVGPSGG